MKTLAATRPTGHYIVVISGHVFIDGLHWIRNCERCQRDVKTIASSDEVK